MPDRIVLSGVPVDPVTVDELHERIRSFIENGENALVLHVNVHAMNFAVQLLWFGDFLRSAELVVCDGAGVMLGARIMGRRIPQRITYAEWTWQLAAFCSSHDYSLYFLGAKPGVAAKAAEKLRSEFPALRIVGTRHGYFDKAPASPENQAVIEDINAVRPNILLVGFGMPIQEKWLSQNRAQLQVNVMLTGGAVFDYVSGQLRRPPRWMTDNHLEWLGRMLIEPRRLWRRYLIGNPAFLTRVVIERTALGVGAGCRFLGRGTSKRGSEDGS